jgi:mono/diheme cytochrome c family protein
LCDIGWLQLAVAARHGRSTFPPAAAGPRSPAADSIPTEARGPFDRATGESVSNPLPAGGPVAKGQRLYRIYCIPCHGGPVEQYFPNMPPLAAPDVQRHGDGWLYATITHGTPLMPAYGHELEPEERWEIVRFLRSMARP